MKTKYGEIEEYLTKDGSIIRELMHPDKHACLNQVVKNHSVENQTVKNQSVKNQSLAEATIPVGVTTALHKHVLAEELYHITSGRGFMTLDEEEFDVMVGDTICIPPGTPHRIKNTGSKDLKILCCCSPAYSHDDTQLFD